MSNDIMQFQSRRIRLLLSLALLNHPVQLHFKRPPLGQWFLSGSIPLGPFSLIFGEDYVRKIHLSREGGRFEHGVDVLFFYARTNGRWSH